jgi:hypothetical protein
LLIAIVAFDLAPDALADGAQHDTPAVVLVATAGSAAVVLWWLLKSASSGVEAAGGSARRPGDSRHTGPWKGPRWASRPLPTCGPARWCWSG